MPSGSSLVSWLCCPGGFFFRSGRFLLRLLVGACFWRPRPQRQGQCLCCCGLRDFTRLRKIGKKVLVPPIIQLLADPATDSQETVVLEAHVQRVAFSLMWLTLSARSGCLDYNHRCSLEIPVFQTQKQNKPPKVPIPFCISTSPFWSSRHEEPQDGFRGSGLFTQPPIRPNLPPGTPPVCRDVARGCRLH